MTQQTNTNSNNTVSASIQGSLPLISSVTSPTVIGTGVSSYKSIWEEPVFSINNTNGDIKIKFGGEENGTNLILELMPESNITPYESLQLNILMAACIKTNFFSASEVMIFVRKECLERHFKFIRTNP
jgi:hypothetical protein